MTRPRVHLDADASNASLERELRKRGHDVTRAPNEWIKTEANDEEVLLSAAKRGRVVFTFNTRDFVRLARRIFKHAGIIISPQHPMPRVLKALDRFFNEITAEEMQDRVRWLSDWEKEE